MNAENLYRQLQKINEVKGYFFNRDIICPCAYRESDVREFGSCYCQLYVSREWNDGTREKVYVPERRAEEKC